MENWEEIFAISILEKALCQEYIKDSQKLALEEQSN